MLLFFRDFSNGYLLAEIFSWYFPQDIEMHNFNTGESLVSKQLNWNVLKMVSETLQKHISTSSN